MPETFNMIMKRTTMSLIVKNSKTLGGRTMPDIKVVILACSILIIAVNKLVPQDHPSYKVITYVVRGIILVLFAIFIYSRFLKN